MSEETFNLIESSMEELKAKADELGIKYPGNVSAAKLRNDIQGILEAKNNDPIKAEAEARDEAYKNAIRLVRVVVTPNDPQKNQYNGEIFTVCNSLVGTIKKFVPFNNQNGWHIPEIMAAMLEEKEVQIFESRKINNKEVVRAKLIKAYNVRRLKPLSQEELDKLAQDQRARQALED